MIDYTVDLWYRHPIDGATSIYTVDLTADSLYDAEMLALNDFYDYWEDGRYNPDVFDVNVKESPRWPTK